MILIILEYLNSNICAKLQHFLDKNPQNQNYQVAMLKSYLLDKNYD